VGLPKSLAALRERNYRLLFFGQVASVVGDNMTPVALSFAILDRSGNARQVGVVLGASTVAMIVFLLGGGIIADRIPRRLVMLSSDVLRFLAQSLTAALLIDGHWHLWQLVALQVVWGAAAAFFFPAMTGLVPEVVSQHRLQQANALQNLSWSIGAVAGPGLAGLLVATTGAGAAVAVDAATFLVSAGTLFRLRLPARTARNGRSTALGDLRDGWRLFRSKTWLWVIVLQFSLWHMLVYAPVIVLGAVVAKEHLGGAAAWGTILAVFGIGSVLGGVVALHVRPRRPLLVATLCTLGFAPTPALLAAVAPVPVIAAGALLGGAGFAMFGTLWDTTLQREIPREMLSRVSSYDWLGSLALLPVGYALAGPIAATLGVSTTLWLATGWLVATTLGVLAVPAVTGLRWSPPIATVTPHAARANPLWPRPEEPGARQDGPSSGDEVAAAD